MPNGYARQRRLETLLRSQLDVDATVVRRPDHPLLLRGPDVLIGHRGGLVGFFLPTLREQIASKSLSDRLAMSRLAYPAHARFVLVWPAKLTPSPDTVAWFDGVVGEDDRPSLLRLARTPKKLHSKHHPGGRAEAMAKFSALYAISLGELARDERPKERRRYATVDHRGFQKGMEVVRFSRGVPRAAVLQSIMLHGRGYRFERGVATPTNEASSVLAVDEWPIARSDPNHRIRAAAMAGWTMTTRSDDEGLQAIVESTNRAAKTFR